MDEVVPKHAEEQLRSKLKARALRKCDALAGAMVECTRDRLFSVVWACREPLHALNECTHQWTNEEELARVKERWVKAGRPMDWSWEPWPEEAGEIADHERRKQERLAKRGKK